MVVPACVRRRDLEEALESIPAIAAPRPELEQYRTPPAIAAQLLWLAHEDAALTARRVLDLGSGTGTFAIGAALLGAQLAMGVEVEPRLVAQAQTAAASAGVTQTTWFVAADVAAWHPDPAPTPPFDTVVMNPPFGAQGANRHGDRVFYERALQAVAQATRPTVWFLAREGTEGYLSRMAQASGARLEKVAGWDYPILAQFAFHRDEARTVRVGGYRMEAPGRP